MFKVSSVRVRMCEIFLGYGIVVGSLSWIIGLVCKVE